MTSLHHQTSPSRVALEVSRCPFSIGVKHVHGGVVVWALMNFFVLLPLFSLFLLPKYKGVIYFGLFYFFNLFLINFIFNFSPHNLVSFNFYIKFGPY
jgi:hypothetical protein